MSKAEERALEEFPPCIDGDSRGSYDKNTQKRIIYQLGYNQAERDFSFLIGNVSILKLKYCSNKVAVEAIEDALKILKEIK